MREITEYECEYCGFRGTAQEVTECEGTHKYPTQITTRQYGRRSRHPGYVDILMSDNSVVRYAIYQVMSTGNNGVQSNESSGNETS